MSDSKEESEKAKQVKRGITEQRGKIPAKNKRSKLKYQLFGRYTFRALNGNVIVGNNIRSLGKYSTINQAEDAKRGYENKGYLDLEIEEI